MQDAKDNHRSWLEPCVMALTEQAALLPPCISQLGAVSRPRLCRGRNFWRADGRVSFISVNSDEQKGDGKDRALAILHRRHFQPTLKRFCKQWGYRTCTCSWNGSEGGFVLSQVRGTLNEMLPSSPDQRADWCFTLWNLLTASPAAGKRPPSFPASPRRPRGGGTQNEGGFLRTNPRDTGL